ncbi:MAG: penicillin-binding transpeptidase domain-containing protein [Bacteroidota bacterium]|nr:penicillin-binding transpeptidase domain-containing protein [Chlorobiota bacterium]MDW8271986.1 penicillin-binding transpeptidase domain-containing protein [Bacteroidota bacterium]
MRTNVSAEYHPRALRWRPRILIGLLGIFAVVIILRLVDVQILGRNFWRQLGEQQYRARIRISGQRGMILDRNGKVLATTVATVSFALDPKLVQNPERIFRQLERIGIASAEELRTRYLASKEKNFVWLVRGVPLETAALLDTLGDPGLLRIRELRRAYVHDSLAAQVLGITDLDGHGIAGIELEYDSLLYGHPRERIMERIGQGRLRPTLGSLNERMQQGASVELTLDADVQQIAEEELAHSVRTTGAEAGIVLIVRPATGEVIACAQQPSFSHTRRSEVASLRLRAVTDMYEPGSTFKPIIAAAALAEGKASVEQLFDGRNGILSLPDGRTITDHDPLGWCTLADALAYSSNIVFAELATTLGRRTLYRYARDFGFGVRTDIDVPGEVRGKLKSPQQLDRSDMLFMGFGYGIACTPLQLACAYAAIANDGVLMQPYLARRIVSPTGEVLFQATPQRIRRVISPSVAATVRTLLKDVVEKGTGINARIEGFPIAGKTGTAQQWIEGQYSKKDYTASFVGMVPADSPSLVILVMLDRPRTDIYGGSTAAPVFRRIVTLLLGHPQLALRYGLLRKQYLVQARDSTLVPDLRGLTAAQAAAVLESLHLRSAGIAGVDLSSLVVVSQHPAPATLLPKGGYVMLSVAMPDTLRNLPLIGVPLRNAIAFANTIGAEVVPTGTGRVRAYQWELKNRRKKLLLYCN